MKTMMPRSRQLLLTLSVVPLLVEISSRSPNRAFWVTAQSQTDDENPTADFRPAGLQSGPDPHGSTFVSQVVYSAEANAVLMTGATFGSFFGASPSKSYNEPSCFVAVVELDTMSTDGDGQLTWNNMQRLRTPTSSSACSTLVLSTADDHVLVAGHAEQTNPSKDAPGGAVLQQVGELLSVQWNALGDNSFQTTGGQLFPEGQVVYPVAVTYRSQDDPTHVYIVSMTSQTAAPDLAQQQRAKSDPALYLETGSGYGMTLSRYELQNIRDNAYTVRQNFENDYQVTHGQPYAGAAVQIGHMIQPSTAALVVVGSIVETTSNTDSTDAIFGTATSNNQNSNNPFYSSSSAQGQNNINHMDGFLSILDTATGQAFATGGGPSSTRIRSLGTADDYVSYVCHYEEEVMSTALPQYVYVVGSTTGQMPNQVDELQAPNVQGHLQAYLMKLDLTTLEPVWTYQLGAQFPNSRTSSSTTPTPQAQGKACVVTSDGQAVWMAGLVSDQAVLLDTSTHHSRGGQLTAAQGGNDIFLLKVAAADGALQVLRQVGSVRDDALAARGGLTADTSGNAIVVGNTDGSMYRTRGIADSGLHTDVFVVTVSRFGGTFAHHAYQRRFSAAGLAGFLLCGVSIVAAVLYLYRRRQRRVRMGKGTLSLTPWRHAQNNAMSTDMATDPTRGAEGSSSNMASEILSFLPSQWRSNTWSTSSKTVTLYHDHEPNTSSAILEESMFMEDDREDEEDGGEEALERSSNGRSLASSSRLRSTPGISSRAMV